MRFPAAFILILFAPCLDSMLQCAAEEVEMPSKKFLADRKEKEQIPQDKFPFNSQKHLMWLP